MRSVLALVSAALRSVNRWTTMFEALSATDTVPFFSLYACSADSLASSALRCSASFSERKSAASFDVANLLSMFCWMYALTTAFAAAAAKFGSVDAYRTSTIRLLRTGAIDRPPRNSSMRADCLAVSARLAASSAAVGAGGGDGWPVSPTNGRLARSIAPNTPPQRSPVRLNVAFGSGPFPRRGASHSRIASIVRLDSVRLCRIRNCVCRNSSSQKFSDWNI